MENRARGSAQAGPLALHPTARLGRSRRPARIAAIVTLAVVMFTVGGVALFRTTGSPARSGVSAPGSQALVDRPVILTGTLQQAIATLQQRLRVVPQDWQSWANLGLSDVQQARITADPRYYPKAAGALARSVALHPRANLTADLGEGALAAGRHDFAGALRWGERARAIDAYSGSVYGVIGDAQIELGRYAPAFVTFQHMVDVRPDLSSYARVSYARELQGDVPGAVQAMRLALSAAANPEDQAFAAYSLGELAWNNGRPAQAGRWYHEGAVLAPQYFPPQEGLSKVAWAEGREGLAIRRYASVVARYPLPAYVIALGDLYATTGRTALARREYALVHLEERLFRAAGVNVDLELALFDADHGRPAAAVAEARAEWSRRHGVLVADALGWALYRDGRAAQALPYARFATKLGYRSASLLFHRAMIELATGRRAAARSDLALALRINPHFSILYSSIARRELDRLGGRR